MQGPKNALQSQLLSVIAVVCVVAICLLGGAKIFQLEREIAQLEVAIEARETESQDISRRIATLEADVRAAGVGSAFADACTPGGFDYLAIGNSITLHGVCDYWWGEWGMAASEAGCDYAHLVADGIAADNFCAMNFFQFEAQAADRAETLSLVEPYLSSDLDIITVQLGENVSDTTTWGGVIR